MHKVWSPSPHLYVTNISYYLIKKNVFYLKVLMLIFIENGIVFYLKIISVQHKHPIKLNIYFVIIKCEQRIKK